MTHPRSKFTVFCQDVKQSVQPPQEVFPLRERLPRKQRARRSPHLLALLALLPITTTAPALAQQVIDGLPPAPLPPSQPYSTPAAAPSVSVPPPTTAAPAVAPAAAMPINPSYVVIVDGNSPLLLSQVQQVEPGATVVPLEGRSLIQAGVFSTEAEAAQQMQRLADRGILSRVVAATPINEPAPVVAATPASQAANQVEGFPIPELPTTVVPQELEFEALTPLEAEPRSVSFSAEEESRRDYYIVIPAPGEELAGISEQVIRMAYGFRMTRLVEERDSRLGPYVRVGPFAGRGAAERWNRYFRDFGMDARVYFRR